MKVFVATAYNEPRAAMRLAAHAEGLGFDGLTIPDHVFMPTELDSTYLYTNDGAPPFDLDAPWPDAAVLIGAMAAVTERLRFRTYVYVLPMRHPLFVARAIGTASAISGGRVDLGVGVGWLAGEYDTLGADFIHRGAVMDESIAALRELWSPGPTKHKGRFFSFGPLHMEPVPPAPIPILVGGMSDAAMNRAARLGDGFLSTPLTMEDTLALLGKMRALRAECGRGDDPFDFQGRPRGARQAQDYQRLADAGVDSVGVVPWGKTDTTLDDKLAAMDTFARDILTPLRAAAG
jgi:probable F420-dependent oxidoreductase